MQDAVSVIIPCYNAESYIDSALQSIYEQEHPRVELIVVNDGSTDNSEIIILAWQNKFAEKGYCLKYLCQENKGQAAATSYGLKYVTGEYLTLLDADDYFLPGSISKRAAFLDEHPDYVGVRSNGWMARGEDRQLFVTADDEKNITDMFTALIFGRTNNWAGTYMVRTSALFSFYPERNIYPSRFGQNMQILLPVSYKSKFGFVDEPLMVYVMHKNSHSQAASSDEQYNKDEYNAEGYRDIYIHMMDLILKDPTEIQKYRNAFNASYHRAAMLRAKKYHKHNALEKHYQKLVSTGLITLNDKISYYSAKRSPIAFVLRVIRKCRSLLDR